MLKEFGNFLGFLIILFYGLTILNFILKYINKNYKDIIKNNKLLSKYFHVILKIIVKYHKVFGLLTILFILLHFAIQYMYKWISITGIVASIFMVLQVLLGAYGLYTKKRGGKWLFFHRVISVMIMVTILIHIILLF